MLGRADRRLIGGEVRWRRARGRLGRCGPDPTQMEQVILNLVINARDAMPERGNYGIDGERDARPRPRIKALPR